MAAPSAYRSALCVRWLTLVSLAALLGLSCAPPASPAASGPEPWPASGPKTLKIGTRKVPSEGILFQGASVGGPEAAVTFHAGLVTYNEHGDSLPHLAERIPSLEAGDWRVQPDGRMEVTWKLRPDLAWHDGRALTADDLVFALAVVRDDELALVRSRWVALTLDAQAPDGRTFVMTWRQPYILANSLGVSDLPPLPRHLIGGLYQQGDKQAFLNSPYWTSDFIGAGPFRVSELDPGTHIEGRAFDQYVLGRPKIDRVIFRYLHDINVMVANLLAGELDMITVGSIKIQDVQTIKRAWDVSGAGSVVGSINGIRTLWFQFRDPGSPYLRDLRVRQALAHGLDRQVIVDTLYFGMTQVADTLPQPDDPLYRLVEQRGLARYPFDLRRAEQLMAEAGWTRAPDGYRGPGGQRFDIEVRTVGGSPENEREILAYADLWTRAGFPGRTYLIPSNAANANELRAKTEGVFSLPLRSEPEALGTYHSSQIPTEANRWRGNNRGGYANPLYDRLYDEYVTTLEAPRRQSLLADLLKLAADDLIFIPVYYDASTAYVAFRKGITGPGVVSANQLANLWNVQTWDIT